MSSNEVHMRDFYKVKAQMEALLTGDIARESLELAEDEYLMFGQHEDPNSEPDTGFDQEDTGFDRMIYKDDFGDWCVTDCKRKFDTYEEAIAFFE